MRGWIGRLTLGFVAVAVACTGVGAAPAAAVNDVSPPEIHNVAVSAGASSTPVQITSSDGTGVVQLRITDDSSGFSSGCVVIDTPAPFPDQVYNTTCFSSANRISGTATNGIYEVHVTFRRYSHVGFYPIDYVSVHDTAGNVDVYSGLEFALNGWGYGFHVNGIDDETNPALVGFTLSPTSADITSGPATFTATIHATDALSGYRGGCLYIQAPGSSSSYPDACFSEPTDRISGNSNNGVYRQTFTLGAPAPPGTYTITMLALTDGSLNTRSMTTADLANAGFPTTFTVTNRSITTPGAPTNVNATARYLAATVTWTPPASNGGAAVTSYTVTASPGGKSVTIDAMYTSADIEFLNGGVSYTFTVHATNAAGNGEESAPSAPLPMAVSRPPSPSDVVAVAGAGNAIVSWNPPEIDGGSPIANYRVRTLGGPTLQVAGDRTSVVVPGLVGGNTYSFTVTATNAVGDSDASSQSEQITLSLGVPSIVWDVVASPGDQSAILTWNPPSTDGGSPVLSYTVSGAGQEVTVPATQTSGTVPGLVNGQTYTFSVVATNAYGNSPPSVSYSVTPQPPPLAPTSVTATVSGNGVFVKWTQPCCTFVNSFTVTAHPGETTTVVRGSTSVTVTGLAKGVAYTFTVHANSTSGTSPESAPSNAATLGETVPGRPVSVNVNAGDGRAVVSWQPPADTGGSPITDYRVTVQPVGDTVVVAASNTSAQLAGLVNGNAYTFSVAAENIHGSGPVTTSLSVVVGVPTDPPTAVVAVGGGGSTSVSWLAPANDHGSAPTFYDVTTEPTTGVTRVPASQTSTVVTGLTSGVSYTFRVAAENAVGTSALSAPSNAVTPGATVPGPPSNVTVEAGPGHAVVHWVPPMDTGGGVLTGFLVTAQPGGMAVLAGGAATSVDVPGLEDGTSYSFTVAARNASGYGPSVPSASTLVGGTTDPPANVHATPGAGRALVSWQEPASNHGSAPTFYDVVTNPPTGVTRVPASQELVVVNGLTNGTPYTFSVRAENGFGTSASSAPSNTVTPIAPPGAPRNVHAVIAHGVVTVSWSPPASDGGSAITGYTVSVSPGGRTVDTTENHAAISKLAAGAYTLRVRAKSAGGTGAWSPSTAVVTISSAPHRARSGYWMLSSDAKVYAFGDALSTTARPGSATAIASRRDGAGFWVTDAAGTVSHYGSARSFGGHPALRPGESVSSISGTPSGNGYWLFTNRGRALAYGDARFFGDMSTVHLNGPIVASVATPTGNGYYMVGSDGGVFNFGDARFHGSTGNLRLNKPIVGIAPTPDNRGYWLVASDGGVFAFDAPFRGSAGGIALSKPVNGLVSFGNGYLMVASDGGVFDYSNKAFLGSLAHNPPSAPVIGIAAFTA